MVRFLVLGLAYPICFIIFSFVINNITWPITRLFGLTGLVADYVYLMGLGLSGLLTHLTIQKLDHYKKTDESSEKEM